MRKEKILAIALASVMAFAAGSALAAGDVAKGKKVFKKCAACHSNKPGVTKVGPSLFGVYGRKAGTEKSYKRYRGMVGANWTWDEKTLDAYLQDPKAYVKKHNNGKRTSMTFKLKGKRKAGQRADVIAYLKTLK